MPRAILMVFKKKTLLRNSEGKVNITPIMIENVSQKHCLLDFLYSNTMATVRQLLFISLDIYSPNYNDLMVILIITVVIR